MICLFFSIAAHTIWACQAWRAPSDLTVPIILPRAPPACPRPRTPHLPPGALSPCPSDPAAGPVSSSPPPCLAMGSSEPGPPTVPGPGLASSWPQPQGGAWCPGLGLPGCPPVPSSWLGQGRPWLTSPALSPTGRPCHYGHHGRQSTAAEALYM